MVWLRIKALRINLAEARLMVAEPEAFEQMAADEMGRLNQEIEAIEAQLNTLPEPTRRTYYAQACPPGWQSISLQAPGLGSQVALQPVSRQPGDPFQRTGFLEQVRGAGHDGQLFDRPQVS